MKFKEQFRIDFFEKANEDGGDVDRTFYIINEKDLYIKWLEEKIEIITG